MQIPEKSPLQASPSSNRTTEEPLQTNAEPIEVPARGVQPDTVSLTDKGREYRNAVHQAQALPDVRMERVMQIKRQLAEGTYRMQGDRIASNMMDETIENNTVLTHIDLNV